jgi:thiamine-monophosphate kinase
MKIKDIGEFGLIDKITRKPKDKDILIGIGDDAAVINQYKGLQVLTTDCLVEGDHFRREWFSPEQIGMKAIEINVSDVAAMGGIPRFALVSLAIPKDLDVGLIEGMYKGMWKICEKYDIEIIGGNMTHCDCIVLSITLIGIVEKDRLSLRNEAKPGDKIYVSGPIGNGRAGLRLFLKGIQGFEKVKTLYLEPKANLDLALKISPYVNAMIDISDGLAPEIGHICKNSKCGALIYKEKIPISDNVRDVARHLLEDEYDYALYGGEDFQLLYTVPKQNLSKVDGFLIGEITEGDEIVLSDNYEKRKLKLSGYDHFSDSIFY